MKTVCFIQQKLSSNRFEKNKKTTAMKTYNAPKIETVILDNEIALVLASDPPIGPGETNNNLPEHFRNQPFFENLNS